MLKNIKNIAGKARQHKILIQNFSYLSALQIFNMVLPLITYPYLIRVLGKETYGLVVFAQAVIGYLVILVGFGFNISATKEISIHRNNKEKLSEIVSSVLIIKGILFLISVVLLVILVFLIPRAHEYKILFFLTLWMCLYDFIFPIWYFQGIEKMKYITYITLISRVTFLGLIFILIHRPSDYLFIPIINGIGAILAGLYSLYIVFVKQKIYFQTQKLSTLKFYLIDSIPIFLSSISIRLYVNSNKVIIGAFLGMTDVAYYDLAEKITSVLKIPQTILSQTLFPQVSKEKNRGFIRKIFNISVIFNLLLLAGILISSKYLILFLGGPQMLDAVIVLNILAITLPIIAMSHIFGIQLLIPFGYQKLYSRAIITSAIIYSIQVLIILTISELSIINISIITVITEIFGMTYMFHFCRKFKLWK